MAWTRRWFSPQLGPEEDAREPIVAGPKRVRLRDEPVAARRATYLIRPRYAAAAMLPSRVRPPTWSTTRSAPCALVSPAPRRRNRSCGSYNNEFCVDMLVRVVFLPLRFPVVAGEVTARCLRRRRADPLSRLLLRHDARRRAPLEPPLEVGCERTCRRRFVES